MLPSTLSLTPLPLFTKKSASILTTATTGGFEIFHDNAGILVPSILHPYSRGSVAINSVDPFTEPTIDPRYGSNPLDIQIVVEGIKFIQKMSATPPMLNLQPVQVSLLLNAPNIKFSNMMHLETFWTTSELTSNPDCAFSSRNPFR
jgi:hypothetical protein